MDNIECFTKIYEEHSWGNNNNNLYNGSSGYGSCIDYNINEYIPFLKKFIVDNNIDSVVDIGCGDFECGELIYGDIDNIHYTGYDAYKKVIDAHKIKYSHSKYNFIHLDIVSQKEEIINADLCIIKDVLQHWQIKDIYNFMDYITNNNKFKYILIANCCNQEIDEDNCRTGDFRNLSCNFLPLKKYNPVKLFNYKTKEVSLISCDLS